MTHTGDCDSESFGGLRQRARAPGHMLSRDLPDSPGTKRRLGVRPDYGRDTGADAGFWVDDPATSTGPNFAGDLLGSDGTH